MNVRVIIGKKTEQKLKAHYFNDMNDDAFNDIVTESLNDDNVFQITITKFTDGFTAASFHKEQKTTVEAKEKVNP